MININNMIYPLLLPLVWTCRLLFYPLTTHWIPFHSSPSFYSSLWPYLLTFIDLSSISCFTFLYYHITTSTTSSSTSTLFPICISFIILFLNLLFCCLYPSLIVSSIIIAICLAIVSVRRRLLLITKPIFYYTTLPVFIAWILSIIAHISIVSISSIFLLCLLILSIILTTHIYVFNHHHHTTTTNTVITTPIYRHFFLHSTIFALISFLIFISSSTTTTILSHSPPTPWTNFILLFIITGVSAFTLHWMTDSYLSVITTTRYNNDNDNNDDNANDTTNNHNGIIILTRLLNSHLLLGPVITLFIWWIKQFISLYQFASSNTVWRYLFISGLSSIIYFCSIIHLSRLLRLRSCGSKKKHSQESIPFTQTYELVDVDKLVDNNIDHYNNNYNNISNNDMSIHYHQKSSFRLRTPIMLMILLLTIISIILTFKTPNHSPTFLSSLKSSYFEENPHSILVIGGSGFIGSHFIRSALRTMHPNTNVTVVDNLSTSGIASTSGLFYDRRRFAFVYGSINDPNIVKQALEISRPSVIVHLGLSQPDICDQQCQWDITSGVNTLLSVTKDLVTIQTLLSHPRIIFGSSSDVYGPEPIISMNNNDNASNNSDELFNESNPVHPVTPWALGLVEAENSVHSHCHNEKASSIVLRIFPVYGRPAIPSPTESSVLRWNGAGINLPTNQTYIHDWIHVDDVVNAIIRVIHEPSDIINMMTFNVRVGIPTEIVSESSLDNDDSLLEGIPKPRSYASKTISLYEKLQYLPTSSLNPLIPLDTSVMSHPEYASMVKSLATAPWLLPLNLLRPVMEGLMNDLETISNYASQGSYKLSIIPYQKQYRAMAENVLHSIMLYGRVQNVMLFAIDASSADECLAWNIPCYNATSLAVADFTSDKDNKYKNQVWAVISWVKPRLVAKLLDLGYSVHLTDTDIGYIRSVWPSYERYMNEVGADLSITAEFGDYVANTGNYIVRPTRESRQFFEQYLDIGNNDPTISDQHAFSKVFNNNNMKFCQSRTECTLIKTNGQMPIRDYSNFFNRHNLCPHDINVCKPDVMYIHPICIKSLDEKLKTIKHHGPWYMSDQSIPYYCQIGKVFNSTECPSIPTSLLLGFPIGVDDYALHLDKKLWCAGSMALLTAADDN